MRGDRIPSLDGFRAISIGLVLFGHLLGTSGFFLPHTLNDHLALGELGVRVFFVISGFLITNLLLTEVAATGRIHIGRFYLRRTFRIFPPYYVFILALVVTELVRWIQLAPGDLFHTLTYTSNYHVTRSWNVGHTWSLSVEEQFYLLWPALLVLLGGRRAIWLAALFVGAAGAAWTVGAHGLGAGGRRPPIRGDRRLDRRRLCARRRTVVAAPPTALSSGARLTVAIPGSGRRCPVGSSQPASADRLLRRLHVPQRCGRSLHRSVGHYPSDRVGRVLNSRPFVFVALISYSIYLWQQLFLNRDAMSLPTSFPLNITLAIVAALASYYLVERPSLRLRQRLEHLLFPKRAERAATVPAAPERRTLHPEAERPAPAS